MLLTLPPKLPLRRGAPPDEDRDRLTQRARCLRNLASSLRAGLTLQAALASWARAAAPDEAVLRVRTVCALGLGPEAALYHLRPLLGADTATVIAAARTHARLGGDLAALLEVIATAVEMRADDLQAGASHAAGALASARTIASLPLGGLAAVGLLGGSPDVADALLAGVGVTLGLAGFRWLGRLLPRPPPQEPSETIPALLAVAVAAGTPLGAALEVVAGAIDDPDLGAARRAVRFGLTWPDALIRSAGEPLAALGGALHQRATLGLPIEETLHRHMHERRLAARREYEAALRRAPVRMILPLTLCVLPGFILVTFGPLLRAILGHT